MHSRVRIFAKQLFLVEIEALLFDKLINCKFGERSGRWGRRNHYGERLLVVRRS